MSKLRAFVDDLVRGEGSTRSAAIIRILFPTIILWRFGNRILFYKVADDTELLLVTALLFSTLFLTMIGVFTRVVVPLAGLAMTYLFVYLGLIEHQGEWRGIQQYWAPMVMLSLTDCGKSFSVDRWLAVKRAQRRGVDPPPERGRVLGVYLIALQVSLIYLYGSLDKADAAWLAGERLERIWMAKYGSSDYPGGPMVKALFVGSAWATIAAELFLAFGLWFRKTRWIAFALGFAMHAVFYVSLSISSFSLMMWTCYLAFIPPDDFRDGLDLMMGRPGRGLETPKETIV